MIVVAAVVIVALLGWLVWRASRGRTPESSVAERPIVSETASPVTPVTGTTAATPTARPARPIASGISLAPPTADFGAVRKGTRAVRQVEVTNTTSAPVQYQVARSECRCLYYEYGGKLAPRQHETLTVTIDGAKAKQGELEEAIAITARNDPSLSSSLQVKATIR